MKLIVEIIHDDGDDDDSDDDSNNVLYMRVVISESIYVITILI